jgi:hypothetical protein
MILKFYVLCRWVRLTVRRYGTMYLVVRVRPRHAACGRAERDTNWGRAHGESTGWNITTGDITKMLEQERKAALDG